MAPGQSGCRSAAGPQQAAASSSLQHGAHAMKGLRAGAIRLASQDPRQGSAGIELALTATMLLLVLTALFDLGLTAYEWMQVQAAAEAGAQWAQQNGWNSAKISSAVLSGTGDSQITANPAPAEICGCSTGGTFSQISCSSKCSGNVTPGTYVQVSAQLQHQTILVYPALPNPLTLTATAIVRIQ